MLSVHGKTLTIQRFEKEKGAGVWPQRYKLSKRKLEIANGPNCIGDDKVENLQSYFTWFLERDLRREDRKQRRANQELNTSPVSSDSSSVWDGLASDEKTNPDTDTEDENEEQVQAVDSIPPVNTWYHPEEDMTGSDGMEDDDDDDGMADAEDNASGDDDDMEDDDDDDYSMTGDEPASEPIAPKSRSEVYRAHQKLLIDTFFRNHPNLTAEQCHDHVSSLANIGLSVRPADAQFAGCYTCYVEPANSEMTFMTLVQFFENDLDTSQLGKAGELFGNLIPRFKSLGTFHSLSVWSVECPAGLPLGSVIDKLVENEFDKINNSKCCKDIMTGLTRLLVQGKDECQSQKDPESYRQHLRECYKKQLACLDPLILYADHMDYSECAVSKGSDRRRYLQSLMDCLVEFKADDNFLFQSSWPLGFENPNLTHSSILIKQDLTGIACILDWRNTSYVPFGVGLARVRALLGEVLDDGSKFSGWWYDFSENALELHRLAILQLQAARPCLMNIRRKLLHAQELGHLLDYANTYQMNGPDGDKEDCFEKMQALVADCRLCKWEDEHGYLD
ncbi:hypothetical protein FJTKL_04191 [Diaporthe vaccinii]|uniref:Aminoglycoside phosphotransferase domain-containing protein n=1 Tax=Diaporthe vaccinii TaxID=105482 RepID=A0ABR4DU45_9PEZI